MGRASSRYDPDALAAAEGLRAWRREYAVTQQELAAICRVSRGTVIRWEDPGNDYAPNVIHLMRLNRVFQRMPYNLLRVHREDLF